MAETAPYAKPLPHGTPDTQPFWDACRRHVLELQRCTACQQFWFPPSVRCPRCWGDAFEWQPVSGRGEVFTFTLMRRAYHPGFADELPYVVAVIALAEGPRLVSNLVGCDPELVKVGMPVEVVFEDVTPDVTLPKFRPAESN
jgi:uncharacterized protein